MDEHAHHASPTTWKDYMPLIVIVGFSILLGLLNKESLMYGFMGYFFVFLSMFKFFDLNGFVEGFSSYDLVAQKFPMYGYAYPFIELMLGLAYVAHFLPFVINLSTIVVMTVSAAGVIKTMLSGKKFSCACLGTVLKVPLSTVSILENVGMALMAIFMLVKG